MNSTYKVGVKTITGGVAHGKNEGLLSLVFCPVLCEQRCVPVDLIEEMRLVVPIFWTVSVVRELHVGPVRVQTLGGVIARWEVNISTQGRSITIAFLVRETNSGTSIIWILDSNSVQPVGIDRVKRVSRGCR
jgi:hypothetical protein